MSRLNPFVRKHGLVVAASVAFSVSLVVLLYILYFQSFGLSLRRALFGGIIVAVLSFLSLALIFYLKRKHYFEDQARFLKTLGFWTFLALLLSPCFFPNPHYPTSPFFQATSNLKITIDYPDQENDPVQLKGVWLRFDDKTYSYEDFIFSGEWEAESDHFFLSPGSVGELIWQGSIGERATLTLFPLDKRVKVTILWDGEKFDSILVDKPFIVNKKSSTPFSYYALIVITRIVCFGFAFFVFFSVFESVDRLKKRQIAVFVLLALLGLYSVYLQFENPELKGRLDLQVDRHNAVISGTALDPWQYRVFAEWLIEALVFAAKPLGIADPYLWVFVFLRVLQNFTIFLLAYFYFRKLAFSGVVSLAGIIFLTGSLLNSFHQSDLSFNTYFDLIFYLGAGLLILNDFFQLLPYLMVFASLNRETSGLIPFMGFSSLQNFRTDRAKLASILFSLVVWTVIFFLLRALYPDRELFIPYGYHPGPELLSYNLTPFSLILFLRFLSFAPFVGLLYYRQWSPLLKRFFIAIVPLWFLVHFLGGVVSEARLFLVPQALVFIPLFLCYMREYYPAGGQSQVV